LGRAATRKYASGWIEPALSTLGGLGIWVSRGALEAPVPVMAGDGLLRGEAAARERGGAGGPGTLGGAGGAGGLREFGGRGGTSGRGTTRGTASTFAEDDRALRSGRFFDVEGRRGGGGGTSPARLEPLEESFMIDQFNKGSWGAEWLRYNSRDFSNWPTGVPLFLRTWHRTTLSVYVGENPTGRLERLPDAVTLPRALGVSRPLACRPLATA